MTRSESFTLIPVHSTAVAFLSLLSHLLPMIVIHSPQHRAYLQVVTNHWRPTPRPSSSFSHRRLSRCLFSSLSLSLSRFRSSEVRPMFGLLTYLAAAPSLADDSHRFSSSVSGQQQQPDDG